jgi:NTE family protein
MQADGVFSGGGIKGLAFAGALKAAEEAGYDDWVSLAGTSAGAITAMALAVGYRADELHQKLLDFDFSKLDDRGGPLGVGVVVNYFHHGITRGRALSAWIEQLLEQSPAAGGGTVPRTFADLDRTLRVVGTDIVHSRMIVFPDDAHMYLDSDGERYAADGSNFPIATAVRISAGFPGFFPPITLKDAETGQDGALVDGGVASSLPVFLFDDRRPTRPTWAFRLYGGAPPTKPGEPAPPEKPPNHPLGLLLWPKDLIEDVIDTAINALDSVELKEFGNRVVQLPTGGVPTLKFSLSDAEKAELYTWGYDAAKVFFQNPDPTNRFGAEPPS